MSVPTQYLGTHGFIGISAPEAAFGDATDASFYHKIESEKFETDPGWKPIPLIGGSRAENQTSYGDQIESKGGLVLPFGATNGPVYLAYALGTDTKTGSGAPYTHTLTCDESGLPSFNVEKNLGGLTSQQFVGCVINKFDLDCVTNAPAKITLDILNQIDNTPFSASSPSYVDDTPFSLADYTVTIFGTPNPFVRSIKLSIDNKVKNTFTFSGERYSTLNFSSARVITGEVVVILQDITTQYADAMAGTYGALEFLLSKSVDFQCDIKMTKIQWGKPAQPIMLGELILQTLPFTAYFIPGQSYDIEAIVKNSFATSYIP